MVPVGLGKMLGDGKSKRPHIIMLFGAGLFWLFVAGIYMYSDSPKPTVSVPSTDASRGNTKGVTQYHGVSPQPAILKEGRFSPAVFFSSTRSWVATHKLLSLVLLVSVVVILVASISLGVILPRYFTAHRDVSPGSTGSLPNEDPQPATTAPDWRLWGIPVIAVVCLSMAAGGAYAVYQRKFQGAVLDTSQTGRANSGATRNMPQPPETLRAGPIPQSGRTPPSQLTTLEIREIASKHVDQLRYLTDELRNINRIASQKTKTRGPQARLVKIQNHETFPDMNGATPADLYVDLNQNPGSFALADPGFFVDTNNQVLDQHLGEQIYWLKPEEMVELIIGEESLEDDWRNVVARVESLKRQVENLPGRG